jgi:hypothetical protein
MVPIYRNALIYFKKYSDLNGFEVEYLSNCNTQNIETLHIEIGCNVHVPNLETK